MYQHILISTDGSEIAQRGLDHGLALAKALGAKATIVTVSDVLAYVGGVADVTGFQYYHEYVDIQKQAAERILASAREEALRTGVEADTLYFGQGSPAQAIIDTAKERDCDLIAMSSHGRRGLRRLMLGSVTSEVLALSPIPVLVVR
jgi:nucleotide-binding universal stress UspA family protein